MRFSFLKPAPSFDRTIINDIEKFRSNTLIVHHTVLENVVKSTCQCKESLINMVKNHFKLWDNKDTARFGMKNANFKAYFKAYRDDLMSLVLQQDSISDNQKMLISNALKEVLVRFAECFHELLPKPKAIEAENLTLLKPGDSFYFSKALNPLMERFEVIPLTVVEILDEKNIVFTTGERQGVFFYGEVQGVFRFRHRLYSKAS